MRSEPRPAYHRRQDLRRLQEAAWDLPVLVRDSGWRYEVYPPRRPEVLLCSGRYEVVHAFLSGVRFGAAAQVPPNGDAPALYDVARDVCHDMGLSWTDPRTGITHDPPSKPEAL